MPYVYKFSTNTEQKSNLIPHPLPTPTCFYDMLFLAPQLLTQTTKDKSAKRKKSMTITGLLYTHKLVQALPKCNILS
jgi:hypothetical protein